MFFQIQKSQIDRINNKLKIARKKDQKFSIFGSSSHKYEINPKLSKKELEAWEQKNHVKLPTHFAQFLTEIGNGGAGPYYGIYPLEKAESYTEKNSLTMKSILYPRMPIEEWNQLVKPLISDEDVSDEVYDAARENVFGGMLCFGTQGCEYDMYIVLEGDYIGRVVYTADFYPDHPFFFTYEENFLDWYERWLDEIILDYEISWFGYKMPGDENHLIEVYQNTQQVTIKTEVLDAMLKFKTLSRHTIDFLTGIANKKMEGYLAAVQLICKASFDEGRIYLLEMIQSENEEELLNAVKTLHWYGKTSNIEELINIIVKRPVSNPETLRFIGYVLESREKVTLIR